jgi:hypothetical protein
VSPEERAAWRIELEPDRIVADDDTAATRRSAHSGSRRRLDTRTFGRSERRMRAIGKLAMLHRCPS